LGWGEGRVEGRGDGGGGKGSRGRWGRGGGGGGVGEEGRRRERRGEEVEGENSVLVQCSEFYFSYCFTAFFQVLATSSCKSMQEPCYPIRLQKDLNSALIGSCG